MIDYTW